LDTPAEGVDGREREEEVPTEEQDGDPDADEPAGVAGVPPETPDELGPTDRPP
jgi:hypothetical protein